jgi:tetratricopeptide (TPR) repeat protein
MTTKMEEQSQLSTAELQAALLAVCSRHGWSPSFINSHPHSTQQLAQLCMKELAACRAAGRGELAVTLADTAAAAGLRHTRLAAHRERARGQQQGGALVRRDDSRTSALAITGSTPGRNRPFWHWLPGLRDKSPAKHKQAATSGTPEQIETLGAICRSAGWTPKVLSSEAASRDLSLALLREIRVCAEAGEHQLVVRLVRKAAGLGIQHPRLKRARRQAQALLDSTLNTQLETAIQLREQGQPAASLALLDASLLRGEQSPWIHDNRARALVDLARHGEAIEIWEKLQSHKHQAVAASAQEMLQLQRQRILLALHHTLQQLANQHAWPLRHLGDPASLDLHAYTTSLLQEAIAARDNDQPELSLALLDAAQTSGLSNPWLDDNRARALVHLNRLPDAVVLWQQLQQHNDDNIRGTAQEMLDLYGARARRLLALEQADQLQLAGELEPAISTLTEALLEDPQCLEIESKLQTLLTQRTGALPSSDDETNKELEPHRRKLLVFTEVLNTLEQRLERELDHTSALP